MDFAVLADHRIKLKESEKKNKYLNLARELKKLWNMKGSYTNHDWCFWNSHQRIIKGTGGIGGRRTSGDYLLDSHLHVHAASQQHNNKDRRMQKDVGMKDAWRKMHEDFFNNIFTSQFIARFERVVQGLHVRGCWRLNMNFIFWTHCYDRHVVSCSPDVGVNSIGGFPRTPSVGCGFPYHIWSLTLWESAGNCPGTQTQLS